MTRFHYRAVGGLLVLAMGVLGEVSVAQLDAEAVVAAEEVLVDQTARAPAEDLGDLVIRELKEVSAEGRIRPPVSPPVEPPTDARKAVEVVTPPPADVFVAPQVPAAVAPEPDMPELQVPEVVAEAPLAPVGAALREERADVATPPVPEPAPPEVQIPAAPEPVGEAPVVAEAPAAATPGEPAVPLAPAVVAPELDMPEPPVPAVILQEAVVEVPTKGAVRGEEPETRVGTERLAVEPEPEGVVAIPAASAVPGTEAEEEPLVEAAPVAPTEAVVAAVEEVPGEGPSPAVPDLRDLISREALRRRALEAHGLESLKEAHKARRTGDFKNAVLLYQEALKYIVERPETKARRREAKDGLAEAYYAWAESLMRIPDWAGAEDKAKLAIHHGHPKGEELLAKINVEKGKPPTPPPPPVTRRAEEPAYRKTVEDVDALLRRGRQHMLLGEYEEAETAFKRVLSLDPENTEAIRMIHKIGQKKYDRATMELEATRREMLADIRKTWNPRDYALAGGPLGGEIRPPEPRQVGRADERQKILKKMESIIIPDIDFRQANINDVIAFLQQQSVENDKTGDERKGVNIILNLGAGAAGAAAPAPARDPFAAAIEGAGLAPGAEVPLITFSARYISLMEALKIVAKVANLKYRVEGSVVMIVPHDAPEGEILIRMYDVLPALEEKIPTLRSEIGAGRRAGDEWRTLEPTTVAGQAADWKEFFSEMGVKWPAGSSIKYVRTIGKLVVANTADNLNEFERVLEVLNVVPSQIEIEARFVEVAQTDLDALGFEWGLTDEWEMAYRRNQRGPLGSRQRIVMRANAPSGMGGTVQPGISPAVQAEQAARLQERGFSRGLRFLGGTTVAGTTVADDVLRVASILTNPQLEMVLHLLQQSGRADVLSAPKVTTKSGTEATIKVVTEYIYPTEFTVTPITATAAGGAGAAQIVGGVVEPGSFETREVGVILTVLPEVSPEGQMINLTLTPEVVSEPEWHDYGSVYRDAQGNEQRLNMQQPFFHTRTISTSIQIYNGATVVMGGMITERRVGADDKIPFLGDIPLLGRLFRSRYETSEKRNLLIFVTARLVDPAGRPIKRQEAPMMKLPETAAVESQP